MSVGGINNPYNSHRFRKINLLFVYVNENIKKLKPKNTKNQRGTINKKLPVLKGMIAASRNKHTEIVKIVLRYQIKLNNNEDFLPFKKAKIIMARNRIPDSRYNIE